MINIAGNICSQMDVPKAPLIAAIHGDTGKIGGREACKGKAKGGILMQDVYLSAPTCKLLAHLEIGGFSSDVCARVALVYPT